MTNEQWSSCSSAKELFWFEWNSMLDLDQDPINRKKSLGL